jgi:transposase
VIDELGLGALIDEHVGCFADEKLTVGEVVKGLIINSLGFVSKPLSLMPSFFRQAPVKQLIREDVEPDDFNRFRLGRCLDRLYGNDCSMLFSKAAHHAAKHVGASTSVVHLDSTSFSVTGEQYEGEDEHAILVTQGYSKDHRPDLKQIVHELLVTGDGGIPIASKSWGGNESDNKIFKERAKELKSALLKGDWSGIIVADSKLYTKENAESLNAMRYITRIPHSIKEAKELIAKTSVATSSVSSVDMTHYGIAQRWIVCCSEQSIERAKKTVGRQVRKEEETIAKEAFHLQAKRFSCTLDAEQQAQRLSKKWRFHSIKEVTVVPHSRYEKKGRPLPETAPSHVQYQVMVSFCANPAAIERANQDSAAYIIATNVSRNELSDELVLQKYKEQQKVERGFRFLKDPLFFVSSLFLKKPERIEALLMVMSLALLVYSIAERMLRKSMEEQDETIPNQIKQPIKKPTLRWAFQLLEGINNLEMTLPSGEPFKRTVGISELKAKIIAFFVQPVRRLYQNCESG